MKVIRTQSIGIKKQARRPLPAVNADGNTRDYSAREGAPLVCYLYLYVTLARRKVLTWETEGVKPSCLAEE
jgi:hypothetical protein